MQASTAKGSKANVIKRCWTLKNGRDQPRHGDGHSVNIICYRIRDTKMTLARKQRIKDITRQTQGLASASQKSSRYATYLDLGSVVMGEWD